MHKVAFVYDVPPSKSDWIYAQELGREHILDVFHGEIEAEKFIAKPYEEDEELFTELCEEGYDIILQSHQCLFVPASKWHRCIQIQKY